MHKEVLNSPLHLINNAYETLKKPKDDGGTQMDRMYPLQNIHKCYILF